MKRAKTLVTELGRRAPQQIVDEIQAAIRSGKSDAELKELKQRLGYIQDILDEKAST